MPAVGAGGEPDDLSGGDAADGPAQVGDDTVGAARRLARAVPRWLRRAAVGGGLPGDADVGPPPPSREEWLAALADPAAPADLLAEALERDDRDARRIVAANPALPVEVALLIAGHHEDPDWAVPIMVLLGAPGVPAEVLAVLATSATTAVRTAAAAHRSCPPDVLAVLASDPEVDVRWAVAGNLSAPDGALVFLAVDAEPDVAMAALANPAVPATALRSALFGPPGPGREQLRAQAAANPSLPDQLMRAISRRSGEDSWRDAVGYVCENPRVPADVLDTIVACPPPPYRGDARISPVWEGHLVRNPRTSAWALAVLAVRGHEITRPRVADRVGLPEDADSVTAVTARRMPTDRRAVLAAVTEVDDVVDALVTDREPAVRAAACLNPRTLPARLAEVAADPDPRARAWVARSVDGGRLLEDLTRDVEAVVRAAATDNPRCSVLQLRRLTLDEDPVVRSAARSRSGEPG